jgi:nitrogen fixation-related uncharacterized protein
VFLTSLVALLGILLFSTFVFYASRNVLFGLYCLLATSAFGFAFGSQQAVVGSLHLDPSDVVSIALITAGIIRFSRTIGSPGLFRILGLGFLAIFAFNLAKGMFSFGIVSASNEGRSYVGELLSLLYFATIPTDAVTIKKFTRAYLVFGLILVGTATLHYLGLNVGSSYDELPIGSGDAEKNRALPSAAAEAIALCFLISIGWITHRRSSRLFRYLPAVFGGMVVILQHRTVWVVLIICVTSLSFIDRTMLRRLIPVAVLTSFLALFLALWIYGTNSTASDQFEDSSTNLGTWGWRVDTWNSLVFDEDQTFLSVFVGKPIGTPILHYDAGQGIYEQLPPHSEYVLLYLRVGIVGLILFLIFLMRPIFLLRTEQIRRPDSLFPSPSTWCVVVIAVIVYGVTYGFDPSAVSLVGVATALLLPQEHSCATSTFGNYNRQPDAGLTY